MTRRVLVSLACLVLAAGAAAAQQKPPETGTTDGGSQGTGGDALALFGTMPNFKVEESETVEFDYYTFGYLPGTPRLEGRRTTVNYWLIPGSPMPGALGICRHFADATRKAGGEVLYDNDRNIITVRVKQGESETWAEFACDKDRYRVNIIEREGAGQSKSDTAPDQSNPTEMKELNAKVRDAVKANADKAFDELSAEEGKRTKVAAPPAEWRSTVIDGKVDRKSVTLAVRGGAGPARSGCLDCHIESGVAPAGAPDATDLTAARDKLRGSTKTHGDFNLSHRFSIEIDLWAAPVPCADQPMLSHTQLGNPKSGKIAVTKDWAARIKASNLNLVDTNIWSCHTKDGALVEGALVTDRPFN
jgi:hypothetical protein